MNSCKKNICLLLTHTLQQPPCSPPSVAILFQQRSLQLPDPLHANVILLDPVVSAPLPVLRRLDLSWCLGDCVNCAPRSSCFWLLDVLVGFLSAGG